MNNKTFLGLLLMFLFVGTSHAQLNRYGFELVQKANGYLLKDTGKIKSLVLANKPITSLPADAFIPYEEKAVFIAADSYSKCTTKSYVYKKYPSYNLSLEVDVPQQKGKYPFIVWIHGGGWEAGDFYGFKRQSAYLAANGIVGVRISYSLLPQGGNMEKAWADIKDALRFVKQHAKELSIDTANFGFAGHSAGAHLAAYAAMRTNGTKLLMAFNGPYNLNKIMPGYEPNEHHFQFLGKTVKDRAAASPINFVHAKAPFCLLGYSTGDYLIDPLQVSLFEQALKKQKVPYEVMIKDGYSHACFLATDMYEPTLMKMLIYSKKYLI